MIHPAEQAVVRHALERGFLSQAQVDAALAQLEVQRRAAQRASLLHLLAGQLRPEQREELKAVYQQALAGDATMAPQVLEPAAPPPGPPPPSGGFPAAREEATIGPQPVVPARFQLPVAPPPLMQGGTHIGPFRIVKELARGGMGVVFIAEHTQLGRQVALKTLIAAPGLAKSPQVGRFQTEARAAARLRHPNIVAVHDVGVADGRHYLSMDLIEGESLKDRLNTLDYLDPHRAAEITLDLARALGYAHQQNVLHRDLKPANILLRAGDDTPLLTDFGLAKLVEDSQAFTRTGEIMGTAHYMPPEQARGDKTKMSPRSDLYGLGATLYHMLTGRPPFQGASLHIVLGALLAGELEPPSQVVRDVPRDLSAVCMKCLERDPEDRYASMAELAEDLERFLAGSSVLAGSTRRRRPLLLSALLLPLLALGGWFLSRNAPQKHTATRPDPLETQAHAPASKTPPAERNTGRGSGTPHAIDPAREWTDAEKRMPWRAFQVKPHPQGRTDGAMAYDAERGVTVLFGGLTAGERVLQDTWTWAGKAWNLKQPRRRPPPRFGHGMAYDASRKRVVMYGGTNWSSVAASLSGTKQDLWEWDGETWEQIEYPGEGPGKRAWFVMAYAPDLQQVLLYAGKQGNLLRSDLWAWNGTRWTRLAARSPAKGTVSHGGAYDARRKTFVTFGDWNRIGFRHDSVYEWQQGPGWSRVPPATSGRSPHGRRDLRMVYARGSVLMMGGFGGGKRRNAVWRWGGARWGIRKRGPREPYFPDRRCKQAMAWDSRRQVLVVFGGEGRRAQLLDDTWEYRGPVDATAFTSKPKRAEEAPPAKQGAWQEIFDLPTSPSLRWSHSLVYDPRRSSTLLFGGRNKREPFGDTWSWNGKRWTKLAPTRAPPPRYGHGVAYDRKRGRVVLYGGSSRPSDTGRATFSDLWEWDGSTWVSVPSPSPNPGSRAWHVMAYAPDLGKTVLHGGMNEQGRPQSDLWTWDGEAWAKVSAHSPAGRRDSHAGAYDEGRRALVLFGNRWAWKQTTDPTFEWRGGAWRQVDPRGAPHPPHGRIASTMTYASGQLLQFGGFRLGFSSSLWRWDGSCWLRLKHPPGSKALAGRCWTPLTYDTQRKTLVVFGGQGNGDQPLGDTWEYSGPLDAAAFEPPPPKRPEPGPWGQWVQRSPRTAPAKRYSYGAAYDPQRGETILYGGLTVTPRGWSAFRDTWAWNGREWRQLEPKRSPPPRYGHRLAYDEARQRIVLYGGLERSSHKKWGRRFMGDVWEWDGKEWAPVAFSGQGPGPRAAFGMVYAPSLKKVLLHGGSRGKRNLRDLWAWDGAAWSRPKIVSGDPGQRYGFGAAWSRRREAFVVIGARRNTHPEVEPVFEWRQGRWTRHLPTPAPQGRQIQGAADDGQGTLVFGGTMGFTLGDTWDWTGARWRKVQVLASPPARIGAELVWDPRRGVTVMFGGAAGKAGGWTPLGDTWEFRRSPWTQRRTAHAPPPRWYAAMAYDAKRKQTVLFGGEQIRAGRPVLGDTWVWNGHDWRELKPRHRPAPRYGHGMTYDAARGRVVLYGGTNNDTRRASNAGTLDDLWEWDGADWKRIPFKGGPGPRGFHGMVYAPDLKQTLLLAGKRDIQHPNDVWAWDGKTWSQLPTRGYRGSGRYLHAVAYDPKRRLLSSIGGWRRVYPPQEKALLEWSGGTFKVRNPAPPALPPGRSGSTAVHDGRQLLLLGGLGSRFLDGLWSWNGERWTEVRRLAREFPWPPARAYHTAVWDSHREVMVVFGGTPTGRRGLNDTWEYWPR